VLRVGRQRHWQQVPKGRAQKVHSSWQPSRQKSCRLNTGLIMARIKILENPNFY
jgi:hypothetical protein